MKRCLRICRKCGRPALCGTRKPNGRRGFIHRKHHDLCSACFRAALDHVRATYRDEAISA